MSRSEWNAAKKFQGTVYGVVLDDAGSMDYYDTEEEARQWADGAPIMTVTMELLPYEKRR